MIQGFYSSASAMNGFQTALDNTSNNLANINTTAFKKNTVSFQDLVYNGFPGSQVGTGMKVAQISPRGFDQGTINPTGNPMDLAINGKGFFVVQAVDGSIQYTRDGNFNRDAQGRLVNNQGAIVQPPIVFPTDTSSITFGVDGSVNIQRTSMPNQTTKIGQLQIAIFHNEEGLQQMSGNMFGETANSGPPVTGIAATGVFGQVQQFKLELSNVNLPTELTSMVSTQQGYVANSKALTTSNQILTSTMSLIS